MPGVDELREAYMAARETASAAYQAIRDPAAERMNQAMADARAAGSDAKVPRPEITAYVTAMNEAASLYRQIIHDPETDLEEALHQARST